jgi:hypothetical protein
LKPSASVVRSHPSRPSKWALGKAPGGSLQDPSLLGASPRGSTNQCPTMRRVLSSWQCGSTPQRVGLQIAPWCNSSTTGSDPVGEGASPSGAANSSCGREPGIISPPAKRATSVRIRPASPINARMAEQQTHRAQNAAPNGVGVRIPLRVPTSVCGREVMRAVWDRDDVGANPTRLTNSTLRS